MSSATEQRASPKPQLSSVRSASLMVDLAQVLVSRHFKSSPVGVFCCSMRQSRSSQASSACCSPFCSSKARAGGATRATASSAAAIRVHLATAGTDLCFMLLLGLLREGSSLGQNPCCYAKLLHAPACARGLTPFQSIC